MFSEEGIKFKKVYPHYQDQVNLLGQIRISNHCTTHLGRKINSFKKGVQGNLSIKVMIL